MKLFSVKFLVSFLILTAVLYSFSFKTAEACCSFNDFTNSVSNFVNSGLNTIAGAEQFYGSITTYVGDKIGSDTIKNIGENLQRDGECRLERLNENPFQTMGGTCGTSGTSGIGGTSGTSTIETGGTSTIETGGGGGGGGGGGDGGGGVGAQGGARLSGGDPKGWLDRADCNSISGWTCDADNYSQPLNVHLYKDGPADSGTGITGDITANQSRESAVGAECGGNSNHGFSYDTPNSLKDGLTHFIYAYGINIGGGNNSLLSGSPKTINCGTSGTSGTSGTGSDSFSNSCGSLAYPSDVWHELYTVHSSGQCLGEHREDTRFDFDADWGSGVIDFGRGDDIEGVFGRTRNFNAGTYKFTLGSDDGSRLYIDGELCIDNWGDHGYQEKNCSKILSGGNHLFRINYYENGGSARVKFKTETVSSCVSNSSCNASAPACGQTTFGVDNCGNSCSKTGAPCPSFNISANPSIGITIIGKDPETCASEDKNNISLITVESLNGFNEDVFFSITDWGRLDNYLAVGKTYPNGYNFSRNPLTGVYYESGSIFDLCLKANTPEDQYTLKLKGRSQNRGDRYTDIMVNLLLKDPSWKEI